MTKWPVAPTGVSRASETGGGLRQVIQTGRVQWYGSMLFGAVALLALALVIFV